VSHLQLKSLVKPYSTNYCPGLFTRSPVRENKIKHIKFVLIQETKCLAPWYLSHYSDWVTGRLTEVLGFNSLDRQGCFSSPYHPEWLLNSPSLSSEPWGLFPRWLGSWIIKLITHLNSLQELRREGWYTCSPNQSSLCSTVLSTLIT